MVVCFIGHRKITTDDAFYIKLKDCILELIDKENADTFLFGSKSQFNDLCYKAVTEIKAIRSNIQRIYVRSTYGETSGDYEKYLLSYYDETYIPAKVENAGKASYVERNQHMIDRSDICIFYYDENYTPPQKTTSKRYQKMFNTKSNSGTKVAYNYALKRGKKVVNLFAQNSLNEGNF